MYMIILSLVAPLLLLWLRLLLLLAVRIMALRLGSVARLLLVALLAGVGTVAVATTPLLRLLLRLLRGCDRRKVSLMTSG